MKKYKKIIMALLLQFSLLGCNQIEENPTIGFELGTRTTNYFDIQGRDSLLELVTSVPELIDVMNEKEFYVTPMYEEDFFENKALILWFFTASNDRKFDIKLEKIDENTVKIKRVYEPGVEAPNTIVVHKKFFIELSTEDINGLSFIE